MIGKLIDKLVGVVSPAAAVKRFEARQVLAHVTGHRDLLTGSLQDGYEAGKLNRFTRANFHRWRSENQLPRDQVERVAGASWDLYRNNGHARKIIRQLESKVLGRRGLRPQSLAMLPGTTDPDEPFRAAAGELWAKLNRQLDYRGRPDRGGLTIAGLQQQVLRATILSGGALFRHHSRSSGQQRTRNLSIPYQVQLVSIRRLSKTAESLGDKNLFFHGIEYRPDGQRVAYHVNDTAPMETVGDVRRISVREMGQVSVQDDVDQFLGVPWFAPILLTERDSADYQENELKAAALSACIALGVRRPTGVAAGNFGLKKPAGFETEDVAENVQEFLQPGLLVDLGTDGEMVPFNPARPSSSAEAWINHFTRTTAAGLPGVKASSLTGDYKGSSFSSERSNDNDVWPELECIQELICDMFCVPLWGRVVEAAVLDGYFDGIISTNDYLDNRSNYRSATWQGPVGRSINPKDDANAAGLRIQKGLSSPQLEASAVGNDWRRIAKDVSEYVTYCRDVLGLPEGYINNVIGISVQSILEEGGLSAEEQDQLMMR